MEDSPDDAQEFYLKCVFKLGEASFNLKRLQCSDSDIEKNVLMLKEAV